MFACFWSTVVPCKVWVFSSEKTYFSRMNLVVVGTRWIEDVSTNLIGTNLNPISILKGVHGSCVRLFFSDRCGPSLFIYSSGAPQRKLQQWKSFRDAFHGWHQLSDWASPVSVRVAHALRGDSSHRQGGVSRVQHTLQVSSISTLPSSTLLCWAGLWFGLTWSAVPCSAMM